MATDIKQDWGHLTNGAKKTLLVEERNSPAAVTAVEEATGLLKDLAKIVIGYGPLTRGIPAKLDWIGRQREVKYELRVELSEIPWRVFTIDCQPRSSRPMVHIGQAAWARLHGCAEDTCCTRTLAKVTIDILREGWRVECACLIGGGIMARTMSSRWGQIALPMDVFMWTDHAQTN